MAPRAARISAADISQAIESTRNEPTVMFARDVILSMRPRLRTNASFKAFRRVIRDALVNMGRGPWQHADRFVGEGFTAPLQLLGVGSVEAARRLPRPRNPVSPLECERWLAEHSSQQRAQSSTSGVDGAHQLPSPHSPTRADPDHDEQAQRASPAAPDPSTDKTADNFDEVNQQLAASRQRVDELERELERSQYALLAEKHLSSASVAAQQRCSQLERELQQAQCDILAEKQVSSELAASQKDVSSELVASQKRCSDLAGELENCRSEMLSEKHQSSASIASANKERDEALHKRNEALAQAKDVESDRDAVVRQCRKLSADIVELGIELADAERHRDLAEQRSRDLEGDVKAKDDKIEKLKQEVEDTKRIGTDWQRRSKELQTKFDHHNHREKEKETEIADLKSQLQQARALVRDLQLARPPSPVLMPVTPSSAAGSPEQPLDSHRPPSPQPASLCDADYSLKSLASLEASIAALKKIAESPLTDFTDGIVQLPHAREEQQRPVSRAREEYVVPGPGGIRNEHRLPQKRPPPPLDFSAKQRRLESGQTPSRPPNPNFNPRTAEAERSVPQLSPIDAAILSRKRSSSGGGKTPGWAGANAGAGGRTPGPGPGAYGGGGRTPLPGGY